MLIVTSCRPNGKSSSRAKPHRYSNTSLAEGIFSRWSAMALAVATTVYAAALGYRLSRALD
jgi:hypothetical protein